MTDLGTPVSQISGIALESSPAIIEKEPDYIYYIMDGTPLRGAKINYRDFYDVTPKILYTNTVNFTSGRSDKGMIYYNGYLYFIGQNTGPLGKLFKMSIEDMSILETLSLTNSQSPLSILLDGDIAYIISYNGSGATGASLNEVNMSTFSVIRNLTWSTASYGWPRSIIKSYDGLYLFISTSFGHVLQITLSSFTITQAFSAAAGELCTSISDTNKNYAYYAYSSLLYKVGLGKTLRTIQNKTDPYGYIKRANQGHITDMYNQFAFLARSTELYLEKFDIINFEWIAKLEITLAAQIPTAALRIGNYGLWATFSPAKLFKINLNSFSLENYMEFDTTNANDVAFMYGI